MSRVYGEPAGVWVRDGRPVRFIWRGRVYTVGRVIDHWVVSPEWWHRRAPAADPAGRECWQVEAAPAGGPSATYDLRHDAAGGWLLDRVWD